MKKISGSLVILFLIMGALALSVSAADTIRPFSPPLQQPVPVPSTSMTSTQPPQGTITIYYPRPQADSFCPGGRYYGEWVTTNVAAVNVALFNTQNGQTFPLASSVTTGKLSAIVPSNVPTGTYETRVTSVSDSRVQDKRTTWIQAPHVYFLWPWAGQVWYPNTVGKIQWKYCGPTELVRLILEGIDDGYLFVIPVPSSQIWNGEGWTQITLPNIQQTNSPAPVKHYRITAYRLSDNKNMGSSNYFTVQIEPVGQHSNTGTGSKK